MVHGMALVDMSVHLLLRNGRIKATIVNAVFRLPKRQKISLQL